MKQVTINLYEYSELNDQAKENAYNEWLKNAYYFASTDNKDTLIKFCDIFGVKMEKWEYDISSYDFDFHIQNDYLENLKGEKLLSFLRENFFDYINDYDSCNLTGYYLDLDILKPMYDFLSDYNDDMNEITYKELVHNCLENFFKSCTLDCECYFSKENFEELSEINEWIYNEYGKIYLKNN